VADGADEQTREIVVVEVPADFAPILERDLPETLTDDFARLDTSVNRILRVPVYVEVAVRPFSLHMTPRWMMRCLLEVDLRAVLSFALECLT